MAVLWPGLIQREKKRLPQNGVIENADGSIARNNQVGTNAVLRDAEFTRGITNQVRQVLRPSCCVRRSGVTKLLLYIWTRQLVIKITKVQSGKNYLTAKSRNQTAEEIAVKYGVSECADRADNQYFANFVFFG